MSSFLLERPFSELRCVF